MCPWPDGHGHGLRSRRWRRRDRYAARSLQRSILRRSGRATRTWHVRCAMLREDLRAAMGADAPARRERRPPARRIRYRPTPAIPRVRAAGCPHLDATARRNGCRSRPNQGRDQAGTFVQHGECARRWRRGLASGHPQIQLGRQWQRGDATCRVSQRGQHREPARAGIGMPGRGHPVGPGRFPVARGESDLPWRHGCRRRRGRQHQRNRSGLD